MRTPFEAVLAERVLGLIKDRALPRAAEDALLEGYDNLCLGSLAGMTDDEYNVFVARDLYKRALRELHLVEHEPREAVYVVVRDCIERLRSGKLAALDGVTRLKAIADYIFGGDGRGLFAGESLGLGVFEGFYYEITDLDSCQQQYVQPNASREELVAHYAREIVRAARAFDLARLRTRIVGKDGQ